MQRLWRGKNQVKIIFLFSLISSSYGKCNKAISIHIKLGIVGKVIFGFSHVIQVHRKKTEGEGKIMK